MNRRVWSGQEGAGRTGGCGADSSSPCVDNRCGPWLGCRGEVGGERGYGCGGMNRSGCGANRSLPCGEAHAVRPPHMPQTTRGISRVPPARPPSRLVPPRHEGRAAYLRDLPRDLAAV